MYGEHVHSLVVAFRTSQGGPLTVLKNLTGHVGDNWIRQEVAFNVPGQGYQIVIQGEATASLSGTTILRPRSDYVRSRNKCVPNMYDYITMAFRDCTITQRGRSVYVRLYDDGVPNVRSRHKYVPTLYDCATITWRVYFEHARLHDDGIPTQRVHATTVS